MEEGFVEHLGITIHFEVYGERGPTILLMPTWTIVHKRVWKAQVRYLSRHFRVVVYDGPGNGRSDRPLDSAAYSQAAQVGYALAVLDVTGTGRAVQVALSRAANWALQLAAEHPERVLGTVLIGAAVWLPPREHRTGSHEQFAWAFMTRCFPEPHSTKQIEDGVGWALETTDTVLAVESSSPRPDRTAVEDWCARLTSPLLAIHGDDDRIVPLDRSERLAALTGGTLEVIEGGGHIPAAREPVRVNRLISAFARRFGAPAPVRPSRPAKPRMLYLSSPIGLGHARRDLAIARALRALRPDVHVDWLTQHPVTRMLESAGERVHPASRWLANESAHIEAEAGEHDLHCFRALRTMDEILVANFMVFQDLVEAERYDLVVADEAWDVDHFLHEDPALKRSAYAWLTDFVGFLPMPDADARETYVTADYNAEMLDHIAGHPHVRDRSIFVGDPADIVDERFGADLPMIRTWTEANYSFAGYVTGFDPAALSDRAALRVELGYRPDEQVCIVTAGGSAVGADLLRRVIDAFPAAARRVAGLRMIVVTGPRLDPGSFAAPAGLELRGYLEQLPRHLAACDLAVVQGGLTTCMELTALNRPFIYVPLRHHFEQHFHVPHRLARHNAGRRMDYPELTTERLSTAIAETIGRQVSYGPVPTDGATRAAAMLADLL
ncbi:alpha/beta fold hydrolase [Dactylosporangium vinaceum]|uniref:Alpha/beta fold hydrolase n=1 Tax=Dactylosporangium vinaceum TaxID=53362 RepID=A0ABV5M720_9ACTN|nr:alpha/beta fold hydrolase [Dactylosporangium vinaceum]UAC00614.1 alpha/beta fold hydrolase [Dactylosporangium vinaceum]